MSTLNQHQTFNVLLTMRFTDDQLQKLRAVSPRLNIVQRPISSTVSLIDVLEPFAHILYTPSTQFPLSAAPQLQWVQLHTGGVEQVMTTELWDSAIPLTSMSGIHAGPIAEYVLAQILAFAHRMPRMVQHQMRTEWSSQRWADFVPREIRGRTLGLVGYGGIGREVARLGQALGMRVVATKRATSDPRYRGWRRPGIGDPEGVIPAKFYDPQDLAALLAESHYVVVSVPLTAQTRHLLGRAEFAAMRPDAFFVNVARGAVIDQAALVEALQAGRIAGAGLDVFDPEPLPADSPLWGMDNVLISPHVSGFTPNYDEWASDLLAENLRRFLDGDPLVNLVDRHREY